MIAVLTPQQETNYKRYKWCVRHWCEQRAGYLTRIRYQSVSSDTTKASCQVSVKFSSSARQLLEAGVENNIVLSVVITKQIDIFHYNKTSVQMKWLFFATHSSQRAIMLIQPTYWNPFKCILVCFNRQTGASIPLILTKQISVMTVHSRCVWTSH